MRQILYISSSRPRGARVDVASILEQSHRNNPRDGVTGLLWTDGMRFLQVLEGPQDAVGVTFDRIGADPRHQAVVLLGDRIVDERQFGDWAMAYQSRGEVDDLHRRRVLALLDGASDEVRATFLGLIDVRASAA